MSTKPVTYGKFAPVIGGGDLKVRVGSKDELKYFTVMPCYTLKKGRTVEQLQNAEKVFYISP